MDDLTGSFIRIPANDTVYDEYSQFSPLSG